MPDPGGPERRVVALAGGVGGAKLAAGLQAHLGERLTVVVNTADDLERHGLLISPDHDTVMYTLAGVANREQGWGLEGESFQGAEMLEQFGEETWFRLGDRDLATHIVRTRRRRAGDRPTAIALDLQRALGVPATILPMTDGDVRTEVRTDDGWLEFQDYFVRRHQEPTVREVRFRGVEQAHLTNEVREAFAAAGLLVVAPSNPLVSIGPILAVPGMRAEIDGLRGRGVPVVAVSPIIAGKALKGPADRMLASLGHEATAVGVARLYADWVDVFVLDEADRSLADAVAALGMEPLVTDTVMTDDAARARLAGVVLAQPLRSAA